MEFDHVPGRGQKISTIGEFVNNDDEDGLCKEIDKCDIVCVICHRTRTRERGISDESRKRMSVAQSGKFVSEETKARISKAGKGSKKSAAARKNMSLGQMGNTKTKGKKFPSRRRALPTSK